MLVEYRTSVFESAFTMLTSFPYCQSHGIDFQKRIGLTWEDISNPFLSVLCFFKFPFVSLFFGFAL